MAAIYPLELTDDSGAPLHGELVVSDAWTPDLDEPGPAAGFRIVALTRPQEAPVRHPAVAALVPRAPVPSMVAKPAATYAPGGPGRSGSAMPLSRALLAALRRGRIAVLPSDERDIAPADVFLDDGPRWDALAAHLARAGRRSASGGQDDPLLRAASIALGCRAADAREALAGLTREAMRALDPPQAGASAEATDVRAVVDRLAASLEDGAAAGLPVEIADDVFCVRAWLAQPEATAELIRARRFLADADVPALPPTDGLALDRAITREQLSFGALLAEPHRLAAMLATFEYFERRYRAAYERHHRAFRETQGRLSEGLAATIERARALRLLNTIEGLGAPLGRSALADLDRLAAGVRVCAATDALPSGVARCPHCRIALSDHPPQQRASDIGARIGRALERQQGRLASAAVRRILNDRKHADDRLGRFLQVAQASDLTGLASVLDDDLAAFLRELLADAPASVELTPVLRALAERFPEVTGDDIETVVEALRQALRAALDRSAEGPASPGADSVALARP